MLCRSFRNGKIRQAETCLLLAILTLTGIGINLAGCKDSQDTVKPEPSQRAEPLIVIPKVMLPETPPETFNPNNLYEKIDGQAELYLSAGFQRLKTQSLVKAGKSDLWVDVFVYDMENAVNAFAVFSMQRRDDCQSANLGQFSCSIEGALFFVHGPYYLELLASMAKPETSEMMHAIAENFIRENRVEVKPIVELSLFPRRNLIEDSISMIPSNAFGYEGLKQVFTANYALGASKVTAFISHRGSPLEAEQVASNYHKFLTSYGGTDAKTGIGIKGVRVVKISEAYEVIFTQGPYLAGVHEAPDKEQAEHLAEILKKNLEEMPGKR